MSNPQIVEKRSPMRTVLITGAAGGIGRATVALFAEKGWRVIGVDRAPFGEDFPCQWPFHPIRNFRSDVNGYHCAPDTVNLPRPWMPWSTMLPSRSPSL